MKEIFLNLIKEAKQGKIMIASDIWPISFNTIIDDEQINYTSSENNITLVINNLSEFLKYIELYVEEVLKKSNIPTYIVKEEEKIKYIISYLFVNSTTEDFLNPIDCIKRRISFIKDNTFSSFDQEKEIPLEEFYNSTLTIKKEQSSITMETPYKLTFSLKDNSNSYLLPSIYYGISDDKTCYIYAITNPKQKVNISEEERQYQKKINRLLYKINEGITKNDDYQTTEENNIKDVSMSFIFVLNIFITLLQQENIKKIKVVPYLPIRYNSRSQTAKNSSEKEKLDERNDNIQTNLTNKLIRTFRRLASQNNNVKIELLPYELDEYLTINLSQEEKIDNMLLENTTEQIINSHKKR